MQLITLVIIGISLSMDAFSLSLAYGMQNINKKDIYILSIIVGIYHFIMPQIGNILGIKILNIININPSIITFIILFVIGLSMILDNKEENVVKSLNLKECLLFGLMVSIDSLSLGISLKNIYSNIIIACIIFMLISGFFTSLGLNLGKKLNQMVGKISTKVGGIILIIIGLLYII